MASIALLMLPMLWPSAAPGVGAPAAASTVATATVATHPLVGSPPSRPHGSSLERRAAAAAVTSPPATGSPPRGGRPASFWGPGGAGGQPVADLPALLPVELRALARDLQRHGFQLRLAPPPAPQAYGQYVPSSRTLWVAPIAFELGIGRQTFLHEAVHAVQSCPSGRLTPIGWTLPLTPVVRQEIGGILTNQYHHGSRLLEQEAFALQGQADAMARLSAALKARCRPRP